MKGLKQRERERGERERRTEGREAKENKREGDSV